MTQNQVKTTTKNTWSHDVQVIANKVYNGAWEHHEVKSGASIAVSLSEHNFLVGTFDGVSYYNIVFQLPSDVKEGQTIQLKAIPNKRAAMKINEYTQIASMKDGEVTAFRFGNPMMGWMKKADLASVKIVSIKKSKVVIQLRLKADLHEHLDFDMNEQFTLRVIPSTKKDKQSQ